MIASIDKGENGEEVVRIFGIRANFVVGVVLVILGLAAYAGPIVGATIWLTDQRNDLRSLRTDVQRLAEKIDPVKDAQLRSDVDRLREIQQSIFVGNTPRQAQMVSSLERALTDISSINSRCNDIHKELRDLRRDVDRLNWKTAR